MTLVGKILKSPDTESLISKYLKAGVMVQGQLEETPIGTPQGGNLSPILSNIILNELDKELEARGLNFVRYADDCLILVKSSASANRVMNSISKWIERKLKALTKRSWSVSLDERLKRINWVIIWKQWKTSQRRMWGLRKLGVPEWMARQSTGFGNHYQAVVKTTGLHKITKEILARRGLISCLDYYLN